MSKFPHQRLLAQDLGLQICLACQTVIATRRVIAKKVAGFHLPGCNKSFAGGQRALHAWTASLICATILCMQSREVMKRELKARQEASLRGLISLLEMQQVIRAEQLATPLQPALVPLPPMVRLPLIVCDSLMPLLEACLCAVCSASLPSWNHFAAPLRMSAASLSKEGVLLAGGRQCRHADARSVSLTGATWLQGVSGAAPVLLPGMAAVAGAAVPPASFVDAGHLAASREVSPRTQAVLVSILFILHGKSLVL